MPKRGIERPVTAPPRRADPIVGEDEITACERVLAAVEQAARARPDGARVAAIQRAGDTIRAALDDHGPWLIERARLSTLDTPTPGQAS